MTEARKVGSGNFLTDNPALYEAQFPDPERRAGRFVHDIVARFAGLAPTGSDLLDIGCGTGRDADYLAGVGYRVTALDNSAEMIAYGAARYPRVTFVHGDMRSFALGRRFDVLTCLDSAMLYCYDNRDLVAFLSRCREHLTPGGLFITEMRNGAFFLTSDELLDGTRTRTVVWDGVPYTSHTTLWIDHAAQLLRRRRIWEWPGCATALRQHSAWRLLFPQELRHFLDQAGFEVLAMFDQPGPRTDQPWRPDAVLSRALSADRLHVVARPTDD